MMTLPVLQQNYQIEALKEQYLDVKIGDINDPKLTPEQKAEIKKQIDNLLEIATSIIKTFNSTPITIDEAIQDKTLPTIGRIKKENHLRAEGLIEAWILTLENYMPANFEFMSYEQISFCARDIVLNYQHLRLSDLTVIYRDIVKMKKYGSLTIDNILDAFRDYSEQRTSRYQQGKYRHKSTAENYNKVLIETDKILTNKTTK